MHEVLVNRLGGLSLPRKSVVRLTDRPDMTLDVYRGRKTTMQQQQLSMPFTEVMTVPRRCYSGGMLFNKSAFCTLFSSLVDIRERAHLMAFHL